jgi:hypothetical protein
MYDIMKLAWVFIMMTWAAIGDMKADILCNILAEIPGVARDSR